MGTYVFPKVGVSYRGRALKDKLGMGREIRRDLETGLLFSVQRDDAGTVTEAFFVSTCHTAAVSYHDVYLCCKVCWHEVDLLLDQLIDVTAVKEV